MNGVAPAFSRAAAATRLAALPRDPVREPVREAGTAAPASHEPAGYTLLAGGLIWVLLVLMIVPQGFDYSNLASAGSPTSAGILNRLLWFGLLGAGLLVLASRAGLAWQVLRTLNPFLLVFILLAFVSIAWSLDPAVTARRMIRVLTIVALAVAFVLIGWHAQRFQNVLRPLVTAVLVASVAFGVMWPEFARHQEGDDILVGAWRGLANHKNGFGGIAAVGLLFWFHAWLSRESRAVPALLGGAVAAACLYLSRSSTSVMAAVFALLLLTMLLRSPPGLRRFLPHLVALFVAGLLLYTLVLLRVLPGLSLLLSPLSALTGKDMSFTGRTEIWNIMSEHIRLHPFLGTGYGAFWISPVEGAPSYEFVQKLNFYPGSAHNGYLEILNELGAVGLTVLFGYIVVFVVQCLRLLHVDRIQASLYLALFLQQAITNLFESRWLSALSVDFVLMTLATVALARTLLDQRVRGIAVAPRSAPAAGVIGKPPGPPGRGFLPPNSPGARVAPGASAGGVKSFTMPPVATTGVIRNSPKPAGNGSFRTNGSGAPHP